MGNAEAISGVQEPALPVRGLPPQVDVEGRRIEQVVYPHPLGHTVPVFPQVVEHLDRFEADFS